MFKNRVVMFFFSLMGLAVTTAILAQPQRTIVRLAVWDPAANQTNPVTVTIPGPCPAMVKFVGRMAPARGQQGAKPSRRDLQGSKPGAGIPSEFLSARETSSSVSAEPQESHPRVKAIPKATFKDPNEATIPDGKDFAAIDFICEQGKNELRVGVEFQNVFACSQFFLYIDTDKDDLADIAVRCSPNVYEISKAVREGLFTDVIFKSAPVISRNLYSLVLPWDKISRNLKTAIFWLYSMDGQDRLPDADFLVLIRPECRIERAGPHPKVKAVSNDRDEDEISDKVEERLLERYRPFYKFSKKGGKEENYRPTDALDQIRWGGLRDGDWYDGKFPRPETVKLCGSTDINLPRHLIDCLTVDGKKKLDILETPRKTKYYLNISDAKRGGADWNTAISNAPGLYGHVVRAGTLIKIEYWQYFAYNGQDAVGDHEGDWCTVQLFYDPLKDDLVQTCHWAHGKGISCDLRKTRNIIPLGDDIFEYRGSNYHSDPGSLHWDYGSGKEQPRYSYDYQDNTVRFFKKNNGMHVVVYLERDAHEFWPTENGSWPGANEHNGQGRSYLVAFIPEKMNLGEIKNPLSDDAKIILRYNGYWGCYHHLGNSPPPGPTLHCQWTFPANEKDLETALKNECEH